MCAVARSSKRVIQTLSFAALVKPLAAPSTLAHQGKNRWHSSGAGSRIRGDTSAAGSRGQSRLCVSRQEVRSGDSVKSGERVTPCSSI